MRTSNKIKAGVAALSLGIGAMCIPYTNTSLPDANPQLQDRPEVVETARSYLGTPYFDPSIPDSMSCIDLYVQSADIADDMLNTDFDYTSQNKRQIAPLRNLNTLTDLVGITDFNNNPDNEFFTRRIQNVIDYQQHMGTFSQTPAIGAVIYFQGDLHNYPVHAGIVTQIDNGQPTHVIHASYSRQEVVEDPIEIFSDYDIVGYGQ